MSIEFRGQIRKEAADRIVYRWARRQFGVVARRQLLEDGLSKAQIDRRLASRMLVPRLPGVFVLAATPVRSEQAAMAACLWAGPDAYVSHLTAATHWQMLAPSGQPIDVTTVRKLDARTGPRLHVTGGWSAPDICVHKGLPVTTPARTLIDLAGAVPDLLEEALDEALRRKLLSLPRLEARLEQLGARGRSGTAALQTLMAERWAESVLPHSLLERRFLKLIRKEGLPPPVRQHPVTVDGETFHLDFAYLESRIAIEADSYTWHTDPEAWQRDLRWRSLLTVAGWTILRTTWREVEMEPSVVVDRLGRLLRPSLLSGTSYGIRG